MSDEKRPRRIIIIISGAKTAVQKPAKLAREKARETRANFRVRWDEALFLAVVDLTLIPWAHGAAHFVSTAVLHVR